MANKESTLETEVMSWPIPTIRLLGSGEWVGAVIRSFHPMMEMFRRKKWVCTPNARVHQGCFKTSSDSPAINQTPHETLWLGLLLPVSCTTTVLAGFLKGYDPMKIPLILLIMAVTRDAYITVCLKCQLDSYAAAGVVYSQAARWL